MVLKYTDLGEAWRLCNKISKFYRKEHRLKHLRIFLERDLGHKSFYLLDVSFPWLLEGPYLLISHLPLLVAPPSQALNVAVTYISSLVSDSSFFPADLTQSTGTPVSLRAAMAHTPLSAILEAPTQVLTSASPPRTLETPGILPHL
jgi:hypothetical protein